MSASLVGSEMCIRDRQLCLRIRSGSAWPLWCCACSSGCAVRRVQSHAVPARCSLFQGTAFC
eukprot:6447395-Alexandrium_andersonii.AAC.1